MDVRASCGRRQRESGRSGCSQGETAQASAPDEGNSMAVEESAPKDAGQDEAVVLQEEPVLRSENRFVTPERAPPVKRRSEDADGGTSMTVRLRIGTPV